MPITLNLGNLGAFAAEAQRIYADRYQEQYEREHHGRFVVIDVNTEKAYVADRPEDAFRAAKADAPKSFFHLIRVGFPAVYQMRRVSHGRRDRHV